MFFLLRLGMVRASTLLCHENPFSIAPFRPSGSRRFDRSFPALLRCHGGKSPLSADLAAFAAHSGHDAGYVGWRGFGGR